MSDVDDITVDLRQGNPTLARLEREALAQEGFELVSATDDELADLLLVDIDSDLDTNGVVEAYRTQDKAVVVSGLRKSRARADVDVFVERPFSMSSLIHQCRKALGLGGTDEPDSEEPTSDDEIFMDEDPGDLQDSGPTTREMEEEEVGRLEAELGLQSGKLRESSELAALNDDGGEDVVEIDASDSMILDVDDLEEVSVGSGGELRGDVAARAVDVEALEQEADKLGPPPAISKPGGSETLPDAPAAKREASPDTRADEISGIGSSPERPRPTTGMSRNRRSSHGAKKGLPDQLVETLAMTSELVARHWNAVSLAARPADRAERLQRVLLAALQDGPSAAEDELRRIPVQDGFSGSLGSWALRDVLMVLIFRRLRGRLEVSVEGSDYVLFIDHGHLDEIENLAGDNDRLLLDVLRENHAISDEKHRQLSDELDQELSAPLEMKLRSGSTVDNDEIQVAKRQRARKLFSELVDVGDTGWFAFMQVGEEDGHSWPVNPLELGLDELMSQNGPDEDARSPSEGVENSRPEERPPRLEQSGDQATREVPEFGPEPAGLLDESGPAQDRPESPDSEQRADDSGDFDGETRESAPWEMDLPPQAESDDGEEPQKETVESGAMDIELPDGADDFFGDSRELDDLLKSVIDDGDTEEE